MKPESLSQIARASAVAVAASAAVVAVGGLFYVTSGLVRAVLNHIDPLARDAVVEADVLSAADEEFVYLGRARQSEEFKQWRTARFFRQADAASGTNSCYDLREPSLPYSEHLDTLDTAEILDRIDRGELSESSSLFYEPLPSARDAAAEADNGVPSYRSVAQAHYLKRAMELETWRQVTYADHFVEADKLSRVNLCYTPEQSLLSFFSVLEDKRTLKLLEDLSDSLDRRQPSYCEGFDDTSKILDGLHNLFLSDPGYKIYDALHGLRPSSGERYDDTLKILDGLHKENPISDL